MENEITVKMSIERFKQMENIIKTKTVYVLDSYGTNAYFIDVGTEQIYIDGLFEKITNITAQKGHLKSEINKIKCMSVKEFKKWQGDKEKEIK